MEVPERVPLHFHTFLQQVNLYVISSAFLPTSQAISRPAYQTMGNFMIYNGISQYLVSYLRSGGFDRE